MIKLKFLAPVIIIILCFTGYSQHKADKYTYPGKDRPIYLGDNSNSHYSALTEINKENVEQLERVTERSFSYSLDDCENLKNCLFMSIVESQQLLFF